MISAARRRAGARIAGFAALGVLAAPASSLSPSSGSSGGRSPPIILKGEFERRGVTASYHLDRVGFRTQEVSNLVIGDPKRPDLAARHAHHPDAAASGTAASRSTGSSPAAFGCAGGWSTARSAGARSTSCCRRRATSRSRCPISRSTSRDSTHRAGDAVRTARLRARRQRQAERRLQGPCRGRQPAAGPGTLRRDQLARQCRGRGRRAPAADRGTGDARPLHLPGQPVRRRRAALRRQGELQRGLHQHRRQRADGDHDAVRRRQRPRQLSSATSATRARSTTFAAR